MAIHDKNNDLNYYDVGVIGLGVAGSLAVLRFAKEYPELKVLALDLGRPPAKRRRQLEGFLGCLPNSDGKLYQADIGKVAEITGLRRSKKADTYFRKTLGQIGQFQITTDRSPNISMVKKMKKLGYTTSNNDYTQLYPKDIHALSKYIANEIDTNKNITCKFDDEVLGIIKQKGMFVLSTEMHQEYRCKKLILAVGRSGWRWARQLYSDFGIIEEDDLARYGIRVEADASIFKDINGSNCCFKRDELEIGPFCWGGTVIPEDHMELAISSFRSNEERWKTDKVSFTIMDGRNFTDKGFEQMERIGNLTFILANERITKERLSYINSGKSKLSIMKEYDWLKPIISELKTVIPNIEFKSYFHIPTILPLVPKVNLSEDLESEIPGLYVVGESAGITGILSAGITGIIACDAVHSSLTTTKTI